MGTINLLYNLYRGNVLIVPTFKTFPDPQHLFMIHHYLPCDYLYQHFFKLSFKTFDITEILALENSVEFWRIQLFFYFIFIKSFIPFYKIVYTILYWYRLIFRVTLESWFHFLYISHLLKTKVTTKNSLHQGKSSEIIFSKTSPPKT